MKNFIAFQLTVSFLLVSTLVFCLCQQKPGVKLTLSQNGINYARDVALSVLRKEIMNVKIPNQSGSENIVIGKINWNIENMQIKHVNLPNPAINIIENTGLALQVTDFSLTMDFNWKFKKTGFPPVSDSGRGTLSLGNTFLGAMMALVKTPEGKPMIQARSLDFRIGRFDVKLSGGASWLYNLILGLFKGQIRGQIEKEIRNVLQKEIDVTLNRELNKMPTVVNIRTRPEDVGLDYHLKENPIFTKSEMSLPLSGEFFILHNRTQSRYEAQGIPNAVNDKHLQIIVSEFSFLSAGFSFQKILRVAIEDSMIPPSSPIRLNTGSFILILPALPRTYPNHALKIYVNTLQDPSVKLEPNGLTSRLLLELRWVALIAGDANEKPCFTFHTTVSVGAAIGFRGNLVVPRLHFLSQSNAVRESHIGEFDLEQFDSLLNLLFENAIPLVNTMLEAGIPLPIIPNVDILEPSTQWGPGHLAISTNVRINP